MAERYQKAFKSAGLVCRLDSGFQAETRLKLMECPKCRHRQPEAIECIKCGVIIAKAQAIQNVEKERLHFLEAAQPLLDILAEYKELIETDRTLIWSTCPERNRSFSPRCSWT